MRRSAANFFCLCCSTSSDFKASICLRMNARSWSRCSSSRILWAWRSLICSIMTFAPRRWSCKRSFSRSSYIFKAFKRSISIIASRQRSSSSFSAWTILFSWICASRMVTTLEYNIIWFICFTSSMSSSSICFAFSKTLFFWARPPSPLSARRAFFLRSSSICLIFSFRATDFCMRSAYASSWRLFCSISSSFVSNFALSRKRFSSDAAITTASPLVALALLW
mmetsp:Transcript_19404/g.53278  ORF Transcript_19404/g.53278 Transcript_19404/m.53278 type:complete len:223 (+) Transcript_19404:811-1479(+)